MASSPVEFCKMKSEAEHWLAEHNSKYRLTSCDESENRLVFSRPDTLSFNLICPNEEESWVSVLLMLIIYHFRHRKRSVVSGAVFKG